MIGALLVAVVLVFALPVLFLFSGSAGAALMGALLKANGEMTHAGSELIETNY